MTYFTLIQMFPDVQRKAQAEMDSVVGNNRLPVAADRDSMPYLNAVCKETLRWHPVAPLGLPLTVDSFRFLTYFNCLSSSSCSCER